MKRSAAVMTLLLSVSLGGGEAFAQACTGVPVGSGQFGVGAGMSFMEGAKGYGVNGQANLIGPIAVGAELGLVSYDGLDDKGLSFGGSVAYKLPFVGVSVCPVASLLHRRLTAVEAGVEVTTSTTTVPLGLGIGMSIPAGPSFSLVPYAIPQFLHMRSKIDVPNIFEFSDNTNEFGAQLGLVLDASRLYVGGNVSLNSVENSDPVYSVRLGVKFP